MLTGSGWRLVPADALSDHAVLGLSAAAVVFPPPPPRPASPGMSTRAPSPSRDAPSPTPDMPSPPATRTASRPVSPAPGAPSPEPDVPAPCVPPDPAEHAPPGNETLLDAFAAIPGDSDSDAHTQLAPADGPVLLGGAGESPDGPVPGADDTDGSAPDEQFSVSDVYLDDAQLRDVEVPLAPVAMGAHGTRATALPLPPPGTACTPLSAVRPGLRSVTVCVQVRFAACLNF